MSSEAVLNDPPIGLGMLPGELSDRVVIYPAAIVEAAAQDGILDEGSSPTDIQVASLMRKYMCSALAEWAEEKHIECPEDFALVIAELLGNAAVHGGGISAAAFGREGDSVVAAVEDRDPRWRRSAHPNPSDNSRGLSIVQALCRCGHSRGIAGKIIWGQFPTSDTGPQHSSRQAA